MTTPEVVPVTIEGRLYRTVREGKADILAPYSQDKSRFRKEITQHGLTRNNDEGDQAVFYNPIQQYNRDLSVLAILVYGESALQLKRIKNKKNLDSSRRRKQNKATEVSAEKSQDPPTPVSDSVSKKRRVDATDLDDPIAEEENAAKKTKIDPTTAVSIEEHGATEPTQLSEPESGRRATETNIENGDPEPRDDFNEKPKRDHRIQFTILDALSASGLRAIRYAKEIPFSTTIVANDCSAEAVKAIELNIQHNELKDKVFPHQGDARSYMYTKVGNENSHKGPDRIQKFDVVDLDPYGTAAPFIDAAIQAVADGGLLCVTCTDGGVWASNGYPEKSYAIYSGIPLKGSQSHEAGLRIILHSIATAAGRYGLAIEPLLSLSIDFYARLFVRVHRSQQDVKLLAGTTMLVYNCDQGCSAWETQLIARNQERKAKNGDPYFKHGFAQAPSAARYCEHCGTKSHLGGPMWAGPLHNPAFVQKILNRLPDTDETVYGTTKRIKGMLTVALEEEDIIVPPPQQASTTINMPVNGGAHTEDTAATDLSAVIPRLPAHLISTQPFFFLPTYLAKVLSIPTPSDNPLRGAFLGLGYTCTRSHCKPGSFKTNAPWNVIWEIMREWARQKESDRLPRIFGEGEFEGKASVKKTSPGAKILTRLRGRTGHTLQATQIKDMLIRKLGHGSKSAAIENLDDLRSLLTSALYDLEHLPAARISQATNYSKASDSMDQDNATRISGKAFIESGGDLSDLDIVFDPDIGRASRNSNGDKLVRYQINPRANWGPMTRA